MRRPDTKTIRDYVHSRGGARAHKFKVRHENRKDRRAAREDLKKERA